MSGPTNRRFVRSAWALLAFQFVAAGGALALAIWAATRVQHLVDQRDLLQARVTTLEAREARAQAMQPPVEEIPTAQPVPVAPAPPPQAPIRPAAPPPVVVHRGGSEGLPPPVIVEEGPPRPPRPVHIPPPREPPIDSPPREPPVSYVPRRPIVVRPDLPTKPVRQPAPDAPRRPTRPGSLVPPIRQPVPSATIHPARPVGVTAVRPTHPQAAPVATRPATNVQHIEPRRIRRPRSSDAEPQQNPPK